MNTDYQWPGGYWDIWGAYAAVLAPAVMVSSSGGAGGRNSHGEFIAITLNSMAGLSAEGSVIIVNQCLPPNSPLVSSVFLNPPQQQHGQTDSAAEKDVVDRLWNTSEDIDFIRQYIISDELSESHGSSMESEGNANGESSSNPMVQPSVWWRSCLLYTSDAADE